MDHGWVTPIEAARRLHLHPRTVVRHIEKKLIPATRVGHRYLIPATYFDELVDQAWAGTSGTKPAGK